MKTINDWVSGQTKNKINNLLTPGSVDALTRMVLVNAIYFKADWNVPFDKNNTGNSDFTLLDGTQSKVKMMNNGELDLPYIQGDGYQAVELPYQGARPWRSSCLTQEISKTSSRLWMRAN